jgi:lipopolysaccharide cholinephosphotransferase
MNFDKLFLDNRECGETPLRQTQLVMLRMLKILHFLCEKHEVKYFLVGGSLIGAIRHKGFIPWDDDLDVGMTRECFNRFIQKVVPELPYDIFFQSTLTEPEYPHCDYVDARLRDKYSRYIHNNGAANKWHEGFQLDIFVFDRAFLPAKLLIILQNIVVNYLSKTDDSRAKILSKIAGFWRNKLVYANNWQQRLGMMKRNVGPVYLTHLDVNSFIKVPFEDTEVYIPSEYDSFLKRQFGDYMQVPKQDKRVSGHDVRLAPFQACDHSEILDWKSRLQNKITIEGEDDNAKHRRHD